MTKIIVSENIDYGFIQKHEQAFLVGLTKIGTSISNKAAELAPIDKGHLRSSKKTKVNKDSVEVSFGNSRVPYARIHELGGRTGRGGSVNIKAKKYLTRSLKSTVDNGIGRYFDL